MNRINNQCIEFLFISIGAVPGGLVRWQIQNDFLVNIMGTFVLGMIFGLRVSQKWKLTIGIGFCGALTTFSGWMRNSFLLIQNNSLTDALTLIISSLSLALGFGLLGILIGRQIKSPGLFRFH